MKTEGIRLDQAVTEAIPDLSRSAVIRLIDENQVLLNGRSVIKSTRVTKEDEIAVTLPDPKSPAAQPENIPLDIFYEDCDLLVVNKPKGMVVHPAAGHPDGTLVNALLYHCKGSLSGIGGVMRPGIVHRIDKDTSGLLIVAKNDFTHLGLASQIKVHSFKREYRTVCLGSLPKDAGTIDVPIGRHPVKRKQMAVTESHSKPAVTHYEVLERFVGFTYVKCILETGRTHQIRVHFSYLRHPIAGDEVYGGKTPLFLGKGQCLHAAKIGFIHPRTGRYFEFEAPLPFYFRMFLETLRKKG